VPKVFDRGVGAAQTSPVAPPMTAIAALLLMARPHLEKLGLPHPSVRSIIDTTQVSKSRAYELSYRFSKLLTSLVGPNGRPPKTPPAPSEASSLSLAQQVLTYLMDHPGCVWGSAHHRRYSQGFRHYIVELRNHHTDWELATFAHVIGLPPRTMQDWLRDDHILSSDDKTSSSSGSEASNPSNTSNEAEAKTVEDKVASLRIQSILEAWKQWDGNFISFCKHVKEHLRIPYKTAFVRTVLFVHRLRTPRRRPGRTPDEQALRQQYERFFPGAQWQGDGMQIPVTLNGERFNFNLQLNVDTASGAWTGMALRDEEDSAGVVAALGDGIQNTGTKPLAAVLDNRPSNFTDEVRKLFRTIGVCLIAATKGRAQNKAHVEGAFGLFSQQAPPLEIQANTPREMARQVLKLCLQTFGRLLNHRPTKGHGGLSRVDVYNNSAPSPDQVKKAKEELKKIQRRQDKKLQTLEAQTDPVIVQMLDKAFERLGFEDPHQHFRKAMARHGRDFVLEGIAIFEGRAKRKTLPPEAGPRYLLGIIKNLHSVWESEAIVEELIERRVEAHDLQLGFLDERRQSILDGHTGFDDAASAMVDALVESNRKTDCYFWIQSLGILIQDQPENQRPDCLRNVARRIYTSFGIHRNDRQAYVLQVARFVWPQS